MATNGADNNKEEPLDKGVSANAEKEALEAEVSRFRYDCAQFGEKKKTFLKKREAYAIRKNAHQARNIDVEVEQLNNNFELQRRAMVDKHIARANSLQAHFKKLESKLNEQLRNPPRSPYEIRKFQSEIEQQEKKISVLRSSLSKEEKELEAEKIALPQRLSRAVDNLVTQFNAEKKSLGAENAQLLSMKEELLIEKEQLAERYKTIQKKIAQYRAKKEPSLELDPIHSSSCVFALKSNANSGHIRTLIPIFPEHQF